MGDQVDRRFLAVDACWMFPISGRCGVSTGYWPVS